MGRMSEDELEDYFTGLGWDPYFVTGNDPLKMHKEMAETLDHIVKEIEKLKTGKGKKWPMLVLTTPKGWTGPTEVDGKKIEGSFRAHQIPITIDSEEKLTMLEKWLKSYHPEELFNEKGQVKKEIKDLTPTPAKCMGASSYANGGLLTKEIVTPKWENYGINISKPGIVVKQDTMELGNYVRDLFKLNSKSKNFRIFGPDEALSNRFNHIFEYEKRNWDSTILESDEFLSKTGRVMDSYLSEHVCEGMLEGYLLTGRYGYIHSYEAFVRIIDSMVSQHAKWLKTTKEIKWRAPINSLNLLLVSHVFQQDHNGYTHQDPGFLNHIVTKKKDITRIYLPPDTNCLLSTFDHCIKTKDKINVIVASKHPRPQWLSVDAAKKHCKNGISKWTFASTDGNTTPDIVIACAGETPTMEAIAAAEILKKCVKGIKIRVINVVDLMRLDKNHPHGLTDEQYDELFTKNKPVIFNFHGYPSLIHELTYNRTNQNMLVHGYEEEGTITTTFDIRVQNRIDRFNLVKDAIRMIPKYQKNADVLVEWCDKMLKEHKRYITTYGIDMPYVKDWVFNKDEEVL